MSNTFTCAQCLGTFEKERSDEEAMAESLIKFGDGLDDPVVICDDCFKNCEAKEQSYLESRKKLEDSLGNIDPVLKNIIVRYMVGSYPNYIIWGNKEPPDKD